MRTDDMSQWIGRDLRSADDEKVGELREVCVDRLTREPEWVEVRGGVFVMNKSFVPMARGSRNDVPASGVSPTPV